MLLKSRPETIHDFAIWLREAIDELEAVRGSPESDQSHYDYAGNLLRFAEQHARYVGAQALCEQCHVSGQGVASAVCLDVLGEFLAWCIERLPADAIPQEESLRLFPNGKPFLTEHEAGEWLSLPATTLRDARLRGEISAGKLGRAHVYTMDDLMGWYNKTKKV